MPWFPSFRANCLFPQQVRCETRKKLGQAAALGLECGQQHHIPPCMQKGGGFFYWIYWSWDLFLLSPVLHKTLLSSVPEHQPAMLCRTQSCSAHRREYSLNELLKGQQQPLGPLESWMAEQSLTLSTCCQEMGKNSGTNTAAPAQYFCWKSSSAHQTLWDWLSVIIAHQSSQNVLTALLGQAGSLHTQPLRQLLSCHAQGLRWHFFIQNHVHSFPKVLFDMGFCPRPHWLQISASCFPMKPKHLLNIWLNSYVPQIGQRSGTWNKLSVQDLPHKLQITEAWSFFYPFPPTIIHIAPPLSVIYLPWTLFFES